jgi:hypothetical protein
MVAAGATNWRATCWREAGSAAKVRAERFYNHHHSSANLFIQHQLAHHTPHTSRFSGQTAIGLRSLTPTGSAFSWSNIKFTSSHRHPHLISSHTFAQVLDQCSLEPACARCRSSQARRLLLLRRFCSCLRKSCVHHHLPLHQRGMLTSFLSSYSSTGA